MEPSEIGMADEQLQELARPLHGTVLPLVRHLGLLGERKVQRAQRLGQLLQPILQAGTRLGHAWQSTLLQLTAPGCVSGKGAISASNCRPSSATIR